MFPVVIFVFSHSGHFWGGGGGLLLWLSAVLLVACLTFSCTGNSDKAASQPLWGLQHTYPTMSIIYTPKLKVLVQMLMRKAVCRHRKEMEGRHKQGMLETVSQRSAASCRCCTAQKCTTSDAGYFAS